MKVTKCDEIKKMADKIEQLIQEDPTSIRKVNESMWEYLCDETLTINIYPVPYPVAKIVRRPYMGLTGLQEVVEEECEECIYINGLGPGCVKAQIDVYYTPLFNSITGILEKTRQSREQRLYDKLLS